MFGRQSHLALRSTQYTYRLINFLNQQQTLTTQTIFASATRKHSTPHLTDKTPFTHTTTCLAEAVALASSRRSVVVSMKHMNLRFNHEQHKTNIHPGGRQFSKNLRPIEADGGESSMWADPVKEEDDSSEESSEEESSEEESSSEDEAAPKQNEQEMTREERRAAAKAKKDAAIKKKQGTAQPGDLPPGSSDEESDDDAAAMPSNPNHTASARKMADTAKDPAKAKEPTKVKKTTDPSQLSRREREALQAQQAKERYQKMHAEGKTDEARADLERLKLVREQRKEAAERKEAEKAERDEVDKEKKAQMERLERQQAMKAARGGKKKGGK